MPKRGATSAKKTKATQERRSSKKVRKTGLPKSIADDTGSEAGDKRNLQVIRQSLTFHVPDDRKGPLVDYQVRKALDEEKSSTANFSFSNLLRGEEIEIKKRLLELKEREIGIKYMELEQRRREADTALEALRDIGQDERARRALELLEAVAARADGEGAGPRRGRLREVVPVPGAGHEPAGDGERRGALAG